MASPFHLKPHVRAVSVDDDLVLLDIAEDGYVCIPDAGRGWARRNECVPEAESLGAALVEAGLARPGPGPESAGPPPPPTTHYDHADQPLIRAVDAYRVFRAWTDYLVDYRGRKLIDVLASVRGRDLRPDAPVAPSAELRRLCAAFDRLIIWLPVSGKCLVRSFLLLRFLQRSGLDADWVFGVRVWPFVAHCWLQVGDTALDDRPERLAAYTPIHAA
ncbi:MAG: lasso peptide biosynthesis B2 protein [Pseudomonadota bacterium]